MQSSPCRQYTRPPDLKPGLSRTGVSDSGGGIRAVPDSGGDPTVTICMN